MVNGGAVNNRDVDTIDRKLELLCAVSASIRRLGGTLGTALIDERIASASGRRPAQPAHVAACGRHRSADG